MKPTCFNFWAAGFYTLIGHFYLIVLIGIPVLIALEGAIVSGGPWTAFQAGGVAAFVAAIAMFGAVEGAREDNCSWEGNEYGCWAGVIEEVVPSFSNSWDTVMPWNAMHDRIDVVLKSMYWPSLRLFAAPAEVQSICNDDADESPLVHCFYFSSKVCGAGLGAAIGAGAAVIPAIIAGCLLAAAITCATVILCVFALIAAALVAAAVVLAGALAGAEVGKALAPDASSGIESNNLSVGNYVSVTGKISGAEKTASGPKSQNPFAHYGQCRIMFFVEATAVHGPSLSSRPYSYHDPDTNLVMDACPKPDTTQIK